MKSTVLHASPTTALQIATDLLARKNKNEKPLFTRHEIEEGFEIKGFLKGEPVVVFRYTNTDGRHRFDYEERLLSFH